ncbi:MAG: lipoyl synthase [Thaumarchaeota archaeon]|nr:lipoyl synthase [Nitrososphaerota archaeon]
MFANKNDEHLGPKPLWLRNKLPSGEKFIEMKSVVRNNRLHTVCEEAFCPNIAECWGAGTVTMMILGEVCTRGCRFCNVITGNPKGLVDFDEPGRIADAVSKMGLKYLVITSVDRDDLPDGGATIFAETVREVKRRNSGILVEVLTPDFRGDMESIGRVVSSSPDVFSHNIETIPRLSPKVRDPRANYEQSLAVLESIKGIEPSMYTKSSIMLGLGETDDEVLCSMSDLRAIGVDILTLGQYLRPSLGHLPVVSYVTPSKFSWYREKGEEFGFRCVASGPLVRSSYKAAENFLTAQRSRAMDS